MIGTWRGNLFDRWAGLVCRRPWTVLGVCALLTVASIVYASLRLEFLSDRNALISKKLDWNARFEAWRESFTGHDDMYVAVDVGDPQAPGFAERRRRAKELVRELGQALSKSPDAVGVSWGYPTSGFSPRTMRMRDMAAFKTTLADVADAKLVLDSATPSELLDQALAAMRSGPAAATVEPSVKAPLPDGRGSVEPNQAIAKQAGLFIQAMDAIARTIREPAAARPTLGAMLEGEDPDQGWSYLETANQRMLFVRVTPKRRPEQLNMYTQSIEGIRAIMAQVRAKHPGAELGLTGIDVIEADETDVATRDSTVSSIIAAVLILALLVFSFRSFRSPALQLVGLAAGTAWALGFATLAVGHLQVISVIFVAMLLGLGSDFGIHITTHFEVIRKRRCDGEDGCTDAIRDTLRSVGPGVATGALTTASAYATIMLTDFTGVAEMGLITGGGLLLCFAAIFSILPALMRIFKHRHEHITLNENSKLDVYHDSWWLPFHNWPRLTLGLTAAATAGSLILAWGMRFDYDLLSVFPRNVESVIWQNRVVRDGGQPIWTATILANDLADAKMKKERLFREAGSVVEALSGAGMLVPDDDAAKCQLLDAMATRLRPSLDKALADAGSQSGKEPAPGDPAAAAGLDQRAQALVFKLTLLRGGLAMRMLGADVPAALKPTLAKALASLDGLLGVLNSQAPALRRERLETLEREYRQFRAATASKLRSMFDTSPLTPSDVPEELLRPYIATQGPLKGKLALEIYPKIPATASASGALDPVFLPRFVQEVSKVEPGVTGVMLQIYHSGYLIQRSYAWAAVYAMALLFLLVWLDFRNIVDVVLCFVPVGVGFIITFGVMRLFGKQLNPANVMVLPLMFGVGVDSGVHVLHRYHQHPTHRPLGMSHGTGKGLTLTSLTCMIGFASMLFAEHRGIASLAFVFTVGMGLTQFVCFTTLPSWMELRNARLAAKAITPTPAPAAPEMPDPSI